MISRIISFLSRRVFYFLNKGEFRLLSNSSHIYKLLRIDGPENISIHDGVIIQKYTWLAAKPLTGESSCHLSIGVGSIIGNFNHIYATKEIIIGNYVLTADKVYISDNQHIYEDINSPILFQGVKQLSRVIIGDGTWIGENVCIIGASIGKNCIIGANSVVTKDIPDYCVAVGSPAKIVKMFNLNSNRWEKR